VTDEEVKALQDELESIKEELEKLEQEKATLTSELPSRDSRVSELEQAVASKDSDIITLKQTMAELEEKLGSVNKSLNQTVLSYKALAIRSNPGVLEELITGDTIKAIDESLEKAKTLIGRVREELETEMAAVKVPAGAPQRTPLDLSALSPREKIQYAIKRSP